MSVNESQRVFFAGFRNNPFDFSSIRQCYWDRRQSRVWYQTDPGSVAGAVFAVVGVILPKWK